MAPQFPLFKFILTNVCEPSLTFTFSINQCLRLHIIDHNHIWTPIIWQLMWIVIKFYYTLWQQGKIEGFWGNLSLKIQFLEVCSSSQRLLSNKIKHNLIAFERNSIYYTTFCTYLHFFSLFSLQVNFLYIISQWILIGFNQMIFFH